MLRSQVCHGKRADQLRRFSPVTASGQRQGNLVLPVDMVYAHHAADVPALRSRVQAAFLCPCGCRPQDQVLDVPFLKSLEQQFAFFFLP